MWKLLPIHNSTLAIDKKCGSYSRFTTVPLQLIKSVEVIAVFLGLTMFNSDNSNIFSCCINMLVTFVKNSKLKIISFKNYKHFNSIHTWSDKAFNRTVLNPALSPLHGGSLEITLTVPLSALNLCEKPSYPYS